MKAWVLHKVGDFRYEEIQEPQLQETEALVAVKAAGVCGSDVPRICRDGAHKMPLIPGHEFAGEVVGLGEGADKRWLHKRVGVYPLIPCRACLPCRAGKYEMCRSYSYLGSRRDGGFAEYVAVPVRCLTELPANVSYEQAAMLEPMAVAVHAMRRVFPADMAGEETVAICGLGTIGMLLAMFLRERGIERLFVIGNKEYQKDRALALGIPENHYCDSRRGETADWLLQRTGGAGADVFFECVGRNETVSQAVSLTAAGGRVCLVGNPYADMVLDKQVYWKILRNQLLVTGTWNSSFFAGPDAETGNRSDWDYAIDRLDRGKVRPEQFISHRFGLKELDRGLYIMRDRSEDYLKVMILPEKR